TLNLLYLFVQKNSNNLGNFCEVCMNAFDLLHPALQHHIVNSLGWRKLRDFQERGIETILAGKHALILAPTAGGKTEAALFPLFSRMLSENWSGLSLLYVCPLKALLNNLQDRLERYASLIGRSAAARHGDTPESRRRRILADPPDCLLTTPESLEAMLISTRADNVRMFENVRAVVVDEIHAFAGDDRGWHLLSVLERLTRLSGREIQRVGLSATVGNPGRLLQWLSGHCDGEGALCSPGRKEAAPADVKLDFVGSLANAAVVISRMHRGEKRLVFCDSRGRVEQLAAFLRGHGVKTYVSHGSLGPDARQQAENAFSEGENCVIAATSALELGIDVGDLDRVIQIDAPSTVSSFLQRMGRTGRREGAGSNCLFLATSGHALIQSAALIDLWTSGFVEPAAPPPSPYHVFAQQLLGVILQKSGVGVHTWGEWIGRTPAFAGARDETLSKIIQHMRDAGILSMDQGILWFGDQGEKLYGYRNFMELCSVFTSPPLVVVKHGLGVIGSVDKITFAGGGAEQVLLLAGRGWRVKNVDLDKGVARVEPSGLKGRSRWLGAVPFLSDALCQKIKEVLSHDNPSETWSRRAADKMAELREDFQWIEKDATTMVHAGGERAWWTFSGKLVNATLAGMIQKILGVDASSDNLAVRMKKALTSEDIRALAAVGAPNFARENPPAALVDIVKHYKFHECLPREMIHEMARER
ncbi:MAG: DEAD/DEAH box helicase, partial [Desulfobacterales bacterium]|nr:DEAD/DEAH box helicase [Desulfobacterales bacterium]